MKITSMFWHHDYTDKVIILYSIGIFLLCHKLKCYDGKTMANFVPTQGLMDTDITMSSLYGIMVLSNGLQIKNVSYIPLLIFLCIRLLLLMERHGHFFLLEVTELTLILLCFSLIELILNESYDSCGYPKSSRFFFGI